MNKTYTLQKTQLTEAAKNKAIMDYHLIDDKGNQRVVHAVAKLGFGKKVKSVQAKYYRETPLVNALIQAKEQQKVEVSYTQFNKQPRISLLSADNDSSTAPIYQGDVVRNTKMLSHTISAPSFLTLGLLAISATMLWIVILSVSVA
jgi:hypothetical protein